MEMKRAFVFAALAIAALAALPAAGQVRAYPGPGYVIAENGRPESGNVVYEVIELKYLDAATLAQILGGIGISIEGRPLGYVNLARPPFPPAYYGPMPYGRGFYTPPPDPYFRRFGRPSYGLFGGWYGYRALGSSYGLGLGFGG